MEKRRFASFILSLVLFLALLPVGVYSEDPPGTARVFSQEEFNLALVDEAVESIIVEGFELDIQQGTELTKDMTITSSAGLRLSENGLLIVYSGVTLILDGNTTVRSNGELRVGGTLVNNASLMVGGVLSAAAPAVIQNNGSVTISSDPAVGEGRISFFDIISDGDPNPAEMDILTVTLTGSEPSVSGGAINWTADVNGVASLSYAMANAQYTGVWLTEFHDERNEETGATTGMAIVYPGDLTITKPLDIFENDSLTVTGNLTIDSPEGFLYVGGEVTVAGNFINNSEMFLEGTLNVGGTATNNGYYKQTVEGIMNAPMQDVGAGDHMKGYYVADQAGWEAALADSAHCNPIVIGPEASSASAIVVSSDTTLTSNLFVDGDLVIAEGATLSLQMRYDGDGNGVMNDVSGSLVNNGTLELIMPLDVCGTLVNNGRLFTAAYNGDENGQNWTENGCIVLYTYVQDEGPALSGHFQNNGEMLHYGTISINDNATATNSSSGVIEGGTIASWWGLSSENIFPLVNEGLLRFCSVELDYTHLAFLGLDNTGSGWYENPEYGCNLDFFAQPGNEFYGVFGMWVYDEPSESWGLAPVTPGALTLSSGSGITLAAMDPAEVSTDPAQNTSLSTFYSYMLTPEWGSHEASYVTEDLSTYRMAITVDLPVLGFYNTASASREGYLTEFSYTPEASNTFYAVVNADLSEGWTSSFEILEGGDGVTVSATEDPAVYTIEVNDGTTGNFGFNLKLILDNASTGAHLEPDWWIDINEGESEGLVFSWADWRNEGGVDYPIPAMDGDGNIIVNTSMDIGIGGVVVSLYYRHQEGEDWVLTPLEPASVTVLSTGSGITLQAWATEGSDTLSDPDYTGNSFSDISLPEFGSFELGYDNGSELLTLPVNVRLPDVAYYRAAVATQENYINEFSYGPEGMSYYLIANPDFEPGDGWTCEYEIYDGADKVDITATGTMGVFLVTVKDTTQGDARLHAVLRYFDESSSERWSSDRDIYMHEAEVAGLWCGWPDWRDGGTLYYPVMTMDASSYNRSIDVAKGSYTIAVFYKHWVEEGESGSWEYTPVPSDQLVFSTGGISGSAWTDENMASIPADDGDYHNYAFTNFNFPEFGSWSIGYMDGETLHELPVNVALPSLGAYTQSAGGEDNWLSEVDFGQRRLVYLVPTVDMSAVDLSQSSFYVGEHNFVYDGAEKVFTSATYGSIAAHESEGLVDYFTMNIGVLPFNQDFDLEYRLRDATSQEIAGSSIRFVCGMPDADAQDSGVTLGTPAAAGPENDTAAALPAVPAGSIRYAAFTSGALSENGYRLRLAGECAGARFYLFDSSWQLLEESGTEDLTGGGSISFWKTDLTEGSLYYLAVFNETEAACDFNLSAALRNIPSAPSVTDAFYSSMYTMGVNVSGAAEGQNYNLYAKIDGEWQWRGSESFDASNDPRFIHLFDFVQPGETAQAIGVSIASDGIESAITERTFRLTRQDVQSDTPFDVELMKQLSADNDAAAIRLTDGSVFAKETYYRLYHEDALGTWDYNASFFGDGTSIAQGGGQISAEGISDDGHWVLIKYRSVEDGPGYTEGWETLVDTGIAFGSITEADFDIFNAALNTGSSQVDVALFIRSQKPEVSRSVSILYALYSSTGRLIDLVSTSADLTSQGLDAGMSIDYDSGNPPEACKVFVLGADYSPETQSLIRLFESDM